MQFDAAQIDVITRIYTQIDAAQIYVTTRNTRTGRESILCPSITTVKQVSQSNDGVANRIPVGATIFQTQQICLWIYFTLIRMRYMVNKKTAYTIRGTTKVTISKVS